LIDFHGDPADRIIVATAMTLGIPLITADEKIIRWNESQRLLQVIAI
jgi:PIN domain nuclease of toxin-antitoxin system